MENDQEDTQEPWKIAARERQEKSEKELEGIIDVKKVIRGLKLRTDLVKLQNWIPPSSINSFYHAQEILRQKYPDNDTIKQLIKVYVKWKKGIEATGETFSYPPKIPRDLLQSFAVVCEMRRVIRSGEKRGLPVLLGKQSALYLDVGKKRYQQLRAWSRKGVQSKKNEAKNWAKYETELAKLHKSKPRLTYGRLLELIADKFGVSTKTIQRHTQNPRKKLIKKS